MVKKSANYGILYNKVAIVTGGASGIGEGICLEFASHGATIAIADINYQGAAMVIKKIQESGGKGIALKVDVCNYKKIRETVSKVLEDFGTIDILVNCAGWNRLKPVYEYSIEE